MPARARLDRPASPAPPGLALAGFLDKLDANITNELDYARYSLLAPFFQPIAQ
jgi:hypothetical protein